MAKHFFYSNLITFDQVKNMSQMAGKGDWLGQNFCLPTFTKNGNLSNSGDPKTNFVCIKSNIKVFQATFNLFVHRFNEIIKIRLASFA